jgi:hypothetical protein
MIEPVWKKRFLDLSTWLQSSKEVWASQPFLESPLGWEKRYPLVSQSLRKLSDDSLYEYESHPLALPNMPFQWQEWIHEGKHLSAVPFSQASDLSISAEHFLNIKGRKIAQIRSLGGLVNAYSSSEKWVDWCGGKGHLLRSLELSSCKTGVVLEKDSVLCRSGEELASKHPVSLHFCCCDVLRGEIPEHYIQGASIVALHACGHLTDQAILTASLCGAKELVLSPCCYHKQSRPYTPKSKIGRATGLDFKAHTLRLPSLQEVHVRPRRKDIRRKQLSFRLGAQWILSQTHGPDYKLKIPSVPRRVFYGTFESFCHFLKQTHGIEFPKTVDYREAENAGRKEAGVARRLGLVHAPFRRAVELWFNLDRVLWLNELNFQAELQLFCTERITARNIVILARRIE